MSPEIQRLITALGLATFNSMLIAGGYLSARRGAEVLFAEQVPTWADLFPPIIATAALFGCAAPSTVVAMGLARNLSVEAGLLVAVVEAVLPIAFLTAGLWLSGAPLTQRDILVATAAILFVVGTGVVSLYR